MSKYDDYEEYDEEAEFDDLESKKESVDFSAIYSIKILKQLGILTNWTDIRTAYFDMTGDEVTENEIRNSFKKIARRVISSAKVESYIRDYEKQKDIKVQYDPNKQIRMPGGTLVNFVLDNGAKTVQAALGINDIDKEQLFDISDDDDGLTQKSKMLQKLNEPNFLLEYLNLNPDMFYIEKIVPGAWTVPMKIKMNEAQDIPIIVTNDKLEVTIKQKLHIDKDYMDIAKKLVDVFTEGSKNIEFPTIVPSRILKKANEEAVTVNIGDLHKGGLTNWTETSFDNWDSKRASNILLKISKYAIERQKADWRAKTLCLTFNGDLLDIDNLFNKTSSFSEHTMQTDSRWNKIFASTAANIMFMQVMLSPYFEEIYLKFNRGNHDKQTMDALFLTIAMSILMSDKLKNVHTDFNDSAFLKESIFTWGKHLFISDHGESENKVLLENLTAKYQDLMRLHPYVNITANHKHEFSISTYGDTLIFREPSLCPPTNFEADKTRLNGKTSIAQTFKVWAKEERFPKKIDILNFERKSLWKDEDIDPPNDLDFPCNMEDLNKALFDRNLMKPTKNKIELAKYYDSLLIESKEGFASKGIDVSHLTDKEIINLARTMGAKEPIELCKEDSQYVIDNLPKILGKRK